mgnify:CR=1 FL=1
MDYYKPREPYQSVSPVLIAGVAMFIISFFISALDWLRWIGLVVILIGGAHSIFIASENG